MSYLFAISVMEKTSVGLYFLPHQKGYVFDSSQIASGTLIALDTDAPIITKVRRSSGFHYNQLPIGTIFAINNSSIVPINWSVDRFTITNYSNIVKLGDSDEFFKADSNTVASLSDKVATPDVISAYTEYIVAASEGSTGKKRTLYSRLLSTLKPPTIKDDGFYVEPDTWYFFARNVKLSKPTLIVGPKGSGKTELCYFLSKVFQKEISAFDMSTMQDPVSALIGGQRFKNGETKFMYSRFVDSIRKPNIVLLDELSRAPINTNNLLLPLLDSRRTLYADIADDTDERVIVANKDAVFIATANVDASYVGINPLDEALLDRFEIVELGYLSLQHETELLESRFSISERHCKCIAEISATSRELLAKSEITKCITTRDVIRCAELVEDGFPLLKAAKISFLSNFDELEKPIIENVINSTFTKSI